MKKLIFTSTLLLITAACFAQSKTEPKSVPAKPKYQKVVQVPLEDWDMIYGVLNDAKTAYMYDPKLTDIQKVNQFKVVDAYLQELAKKVKLDSIKVEGK